MSRKTTKRVTISALVGLGAMALGFASASAHSFLASCLIGAGEACLLASWLLRRP